MISALEQTEKYYLAAPADKPKMPYGFTGETAKGIIYEFGQMGSAAKEALPVLERFATDPKLPVPGFQPDAKEAIRKIKSNKGQVTQ